jgi:aspartate ammonia-lyase
MELPDSVYYGVQTERVRQLSNISGIPVITYPQLHDRLAHVKKAAAKANKAIGALDGEVADAICAAADKVLAGGFEDQFPLDMYQGGGYTCVNMNMNEVLAHIANEKLTGHKGYDRVHPNTHVNMGQSTNDTIPSAMKLAVAPVIDALVVELEKLHRELKKKQAEFADVVKVGRTCLQDAVPMTLGQEFSGYARFVERQIPVLKGLRAGCFELIIGASAVGTGIGSFPGYADAFYRFLAEDLGEPVRADENLFDGMQNDDFYVAVSAAVKQVAAGISKIAKDFRLLSSGPRAGFGEITLPSLSPGSSIMPGKINPIMPELMSQVAQQVCGNDVAISMAFEQGELEINVWAPTVYKSLFESFSLLTKALPEFTSRCVAGIVANRAACDAHARATLALSTVVSAILGYEEGVRVSKYAHANGLSVKDAVLRLGIMNEADATSLLDPVLLTDTAKMTRALSDWRKKRVTK